ncbi:carbohydrate ABC transporter permease [Serinibacter arcticus]|uniref:carbohydrate ABC transporter permease n=1 Tax=Serinibacter arcticus TaxID=1655435 RepID=UPI0010928E12|nr:sugar ABC transporter permease [Serinibacter arcticus]
MTSSTLTAPVPQVAGRARDAEPGRRRRRRHDRWMAVAFAAPLLAYLVLFYAVPLIQNLSMSVHGYDRNTFVNGGAPFVGLDVYRDVIGQDRFLRVLRQTAIFTLASIAVQYVVGLALAVFFQRSFRLSAVLRGLFLVPWLLPVIVSGTTWQWMMNADTGVLNAALGLVGVDPVWWLSADNALMSVIIANVWLGIPFNLVILYSGLQNISPDLSEAAALDGANAWQRFWRITMPLLRPVSLITLLLGLVYTLKVVDIIWIMTLGTGTSQTLATWSYGMAFGKGTSAVIQYSEASAVGSILIVIALAFGLLYIAAQRRQED